MTRLRTASKPDFSTIGLPLTPPVQRIVFASIVSVVSPWSGPNVTREFWVETRKYSRSGFDVHDANRFTWHVILFAKLRHTVDELTEELDSCESCATDNDRHVRAVS